MKNILITMIIAMLLAGCGAIKKVAYIYDAGESETMNIAGDYEITIQPHDFLGIVVNTESDADAPLAASFNGPMRDMGFGFATANGLNDYDRGRRGYLVDAEGNINFPILGTIHVQDMTRAELIRYLESRIREEGYISKPLVTANIVNLKIAVIGEVLRPGQFELTSDKITLLDALSLAGDMTIYGNRRKVRVIREEDGVRTITMLNLNSKDVFDSPYYYLRQNDVVYIEPNKRRAEQSGISPMWTIGVSTGSLLVSVATLLITVLR